MITEQVKKMQIRNFNLLQIIQDPKSFLGSATDTSLWKKGLEKTRKATLNDVVKLRKAQENAWEGMAQDQIGLLLGPPGTGKTFTLSAMTCGFLSACIEEKRPCRIFVTGFTRNSIENVLEYIKDFSKKYSQLEFVIAYDNEALTHKKIHYVLIDPFNS